MKANGIYKTKNPHESQEKSFPHYTPVIHRVPHTSTFAERFAFARLLYHWREGAEPSQSAVAEAVGMTQPGVRPWYDREDPPKDWTVHKPLAEALGVDPAWLIQNQGAPPKPHLWEEWIKERRKRQALGRGAAKVAARSAAKTTDRKRAAGE